MIQFENVTATYADDAGIFDLSFLIEKGEMVFLMGPTGAGKSTILKICCGLLQPDSGSISVMGKSFSSSEESLQIKSRMGVMLHDDMIYPQLTIKENLVFY